MFYRRFRKFVQNLTLLAKTTVLLLGGYARKLQGKLAGTMNYRRFRKFVHTLPLLATTAMLLLGGCAGKPEGTLAGTVVYHGQPLTRMDVEVHRDGSGISTSASLNAEGRFTVEAPIPVGTYELAFNPTPIADPAIARTIKYPAIPRKYRDRKTSGVTVEVKKGKNDVVIELKD